jgi:G3E family GTPase
VKDSPKNSEPNKHVKTSRILFVGGFLGAGKTTLIYEVTRLLTARGIKVGIITNDQAPDLADTSLLEHISHHVAEVAGSCFCCDFKGLRKAIDKLHEKDKPDVILAEPVGSCTDLSATLLNPIKEMMRTEVSLSPLAVLIDPRRLKDILNGSDGLHPSAAYIIRKQLEESDMITLTKTDLYSPDEIMRLSDQLKKDFPDCEVNAISSRTGNGLEAWLDLMLSSNEAGKHIVEVDYDKYAEGEAVLGWLNCSASLSGKNADWDAFTRSIMEDLALKIDQMNLTVGHVKMIVENGDQYISANLTGKAETLTFRWAAGTGNAAEMIFNARVEMAPEALEKLFTASLKKATDGVIEVKIRRLRSLSPGRPNPTHRYNKVVNA